MAITDSHQLYQAYKSGLQRESLGTGSQYIMNSDSHHHMHITHNVKQAMPLCAVQCCTGSQWALCFTQPGLAIPLKVTHTLIVQFIRHT